MTVCSVPAKIHIGTSGWKYSHWKGLFYPEDLKAKDEFSYYRKYFDTVELNNPFYRLPPKETFIKWRKEVPENFVFAVKASRFITHMKKLSDPKESLHDFLHNIKGLNEKLGVVLFQLPPSWQINPERLEQFMKALPPKIRCTFEFRNSTWYEPEIFSMLGKYNRAFCIYELAGHLSPIAVTSDFVYVRLHGPGDKYQGSYTDKALKKWANYCREWVAEGKDVFIYFDNDQAAFAAYNAIRLKELTEDHKNAG
jgi:uncharacterized protein YecE (DUF72 family)